MLSIVLLLIVLEAIIVLRLFALTRVSLSLCKCVHIGVCLCSADLREHVSTFPYSHKEKLSYVGC